MRAHISVDNVVPSVSSNTLVTTGPDTFPDKSFMRTMDAAGKSEII